MYCHINPSFSNPYFNIFYPILFLQVAVTITNEKSIRGVLSSIAQELLKTDITWGKIISLYCVAGGLAVDCVHHGHPEYLFGLIEAMGLVMERDAATWIAQQGGWVNEIKVFSKCIPK